MDFRTEVHIPSAERPINYTDRALFMGSCFSVHIHDKMQALKFDVASNPFGIVYNPISLNAQLQRILSNTPYTAEDLAFHNERWFSFDHHSDFSFASKTECLTAINSRLHLAHEELLSANVLFLTLGSSWVYKQNESGKIVSNCHKLPAKEFTKYLAETADMVSELSETITKVKSVNPNVQIVFSVSPVRHLGDGFFENQVSKGRLFDTIYQLKKELQDIEYFAAYEIVQDDLRDYRFYANDLVHPSGEAVNYIWEKFSNAYISLPAQQTVKEVEKAIRAAHHRPFNPKSEAHQKFIAKTLLEISRLEKSVPGNFHEENTLLKSALAD